jgi:hypothetical protein
VGKVGDTLLGVRKSIILVEGSQISDKRVPKSMSEGFHMKRSVRDGRGSGDE